MSMVGRFLLLVPALMLLSGCMQPIAGGAPAIAQASPAPAAPIKLTVGGYYSAAAGVTAGGRR